MRVSKWFVVLAAVVLGLALVPVGNQASAQEIPQPITRPCKHPCVNRIRFAPDPRLDSLELHGRIHPMTDLDPVNESFIVELYDAMNQVLFAVSVGPGEFIATNGGKRWVYRNKAAKTAGGLYRVQIAPRKDALGGYRVDVLAYGDLSPVVSGDITTLIQIGNDVFTNTSTWSQRPDGWVVDFLP